jgi:hypothetical protein
MSFPEQLVLSGAAIGAGTGYLIALGVGDVAAGSDNGDSGSWVANSKIAINISKSLAYP